MGNDIVKGIKLATFALLVGGAVLGTTGCGGDDDGGSSGSAGAGSSQEVDSGSLIGSEWYWSGRIRFEDGGVIENLRACDHEYYFTNESWRWEMAGDNVVVVYEYDYDVSSYVYHYKVTYTMSVVDLDRGFMDGCADTESWRDGVKQTSSHAPSTWLRID